MTDWYNYVQAVVAHYGTSVTYHVWNEPNDNYFLRSNPGDQGHYQIPFSRFQPILENAIAARNNSVSGATFVVPDITDAGIGDWFNAFWQNEAANLAPQDKLSIHVYSNGNIPWDINYLISVTGREVWLTETGPTTPTSDSAQNNFINYLLDTFQTFGDPRWSRFFYYRLWDNANNAEAILYADWSPRPAYYTFKSRIPGSPPPPQDASFYEHLDFTGASFSAGDDLSFVGWEWNDRVTSVRVPAGTTVILYEHSDYGGASLTLTSDAPDLRNYPGPGADGTWNDAASSVRIIR